MTKQKLASVVTGLALVACAAIAVTLEAHGLALGLGIPGLALALTIPPSFAARGDTDQRLHVIRFRFTVAQVAAFAPGKKLCRLPSRAFLHSVMLHKSVAFNSATTDTIQLGSTQTGAEILAATDIKTAAGYVNATAAAGLGIVVSATGEVDLWARYLQSGAVATLGDVTVVVTYALDDNVV